MTQALLLSHPHSEQRDTQIYAGKFKVAKSKYAALRNLVKQELDLTIQEGEHSSVRPELRFLLDEPHSPLQVTDARATMAIYRLHRKVWENGNSGIVPPHQRAGQKRKREKNDTTSKTTEPSSTPAHPSSPSSTKTKPGAPGGGRKGVSSGLSTVTHYHQDQKAVGGQKEKAKSKPKSKWWKELVGKEGSGSAGSKGSIHLPPG